MKLRTAFVGLVVLGLMACSTKVSNNDKGSGSFSEDQRNDIEKVVADYLAANPELVGTALKTKPKMILEALQAYTQEKEAIDKARAQELLGKNQDLIFKDKDAPFSGNEKGTKLIAEFFDYNCGHCRGMHSVIKQLVAEDKDVKVIYKIWPVFGKDSLYAARAAMASKLQGKFEEFHNALMESVDKLDTAKVNEIAKATGLDMAKFEKDIDAPSTKEYIENVRNLGEKLEITGAPYIIYGNEAFPGKMEIEELKAMLNKTADSSSAKQ